MYVGSMFFLGENSVFSFSCVFFSTNYHLLEKDLKQVNYSIFDRLSEESILSSSIKYYYVEEATSWTLILIYTLICVTCYKFMMNQRKCFVDIIESRRILITNLTYVFICLIIKIILRMASLLCLF